MFARIGRGVVHHPWLTITAWLVITVAVVMTAPKLDPTSDQADFLPSSYESVKAEKLAASAFPDATDPAALMVFTDDDGDPLDRVDQRQVERIVDRLAGNDYADVERIVTGSRQLSPNAEVMLANVEPVDDSDAVIYGDDLMDSVRELRADAEPLLDGTGLHLGVTGDTASALDQQEASGDTDQLIMMATLMLIVVLLLLIFRSVLIAVLPVATIFAVMTVSMGLIGFAAQEFGLEGVSDIQTLLIVVLFGVGADYFLFLMFRYRERLRAGSEPKTAMIEAVTRVGEAITSAAAVVIVAFLALALSSLGQLQAWGPALAIAVAVTLAVGLTLVPAVVSLLGTKVFWPSRSWQRTPKERTSGALGRLVGRRPAAVVVVSGLVMTSLAVFAFGFTAQFDDSQSGPKDLESVRAMDDLEQGFAAGQTRPTTVLLAGDGDTALSGPDVDGFAERLASVDGVGEVTRPQLNPDGTVAQIGVVLDHSPESEDALALVRGDLRAVAHDAAPADTHAYVGGISSVLADIEDAVNRDYRVVFPVAGALILLILGLLLRSVVAPWYLMASVALGFGASLGATVLVFQHLQEQSGLMFSLPLLMYLFVVAIGTDYNILMVARLREEARQGHEPRAAASLAVRHTVPTIAAAGTILAGSFGVLLLANDVVMRQMGFGISIGIVIVAFVMASFLTPALTALMGHRAWWPGHQDRRPGRRREPQDAYVGAR